MYYTEDSIIQLPEGLMFSVSFMQGIADRADELDRAGKAKEAKALLDEFDFWASNVG